MGMIELHTEYLIVASERSLMKRYLSMRDALEDTRSRTTQTVQIMRHRAFTLIEILGVIGILSLCCHPAAGSCQSARCRSQFRVSIELTSTGMAWKCNAQIRHYPRGLDPAIITLLNYGLAIRCTQRCSRSTPLLTESLLLREESIPVALPSDLGFDINDITGLALMPDRVVTRNSQRAILSQRNYSPQLSNSIFQGRGNTCSG
jgi:hypothetical protein